MTHLVRAINKPEDITYIIKYKRRWKKETVLAMLKHASARLRAFRRHGLVTGDEFQTITHNIRVARQETVSGKYQN